MTGYSGFGGRGRGRTGGRGRGGRGGRGGGQPSSASSSSQPQAASSATVSVPPDPEPIKKHDTFNPHSLDNLSPSSSSDEESGLTGTGNAGGPAQTGNANIKSPPQYPFASVSDLVKTGIFSGTGIRPSQIEDILKDDTNLPETPSKTNKSTIKQLQDLVADGIESEELLQRFQDQTKKVRGDMTTEQRKRALRRDILPWIEIGLNYEGPKRPGLFLEDGTRNPARPPKGSGSRPPPGASSAGPGAATTKTGGPKDINPSSGNKNNTSKINKNNPSSSIGPNSQKGTKLPRPKGTGKSPLGTQPPLSADDIQVPNPVTSTGTRHSHPDPRIQTSSETGSAGWQFRDDLFNAEVMNAAGLKYAVGDEDVDLLPELPSSIDYDTENWK